MQVVWREVSLPVEEISFDVGDGDIASQMIERFNPKTTRIEVYCRAVDPLYQAFDPIGNRWIGGLLQHHLIDDISSLQLVFAEIVAYLSGKAHTLQKPRPFRNFVAAARLGVRDAEHEAFFTRLLGDVDEVTAPFGFSETLEEPAETCGDASAPRRLAGGSTAGARAHLWRERRHIVPSGVCAGSVARFRTQRPGVRHGSVWPHAGRRRKRQRDRNVHKHIAGARQDRCQKHCKRRAGHARTSCAADASRTRISCAGPRVCSAVEAPAPLFTALFNYRHGSIPIDNAAGETPIYDGIATLYAADRTNFPLTLSVDELTDGFMLTAQTVADIDPEQLCRWMHNALVHMVDALERAPETPLCALDIMPSGELEGAVLAWNTNRARLRSRSMHSDSLENQAVKTPDAAAVVFDNDTLTFRELNERANQIAHALIEKGAGPDVVIGLMMERSLDLIVSILGVIKAARPICRSTSIIRWTASHWSSMTRNHCSS